MSLLRFKKDQKYLVADTETESLNLHFSRPWQVAYNVYSLNDGVIEQNYHNILWPDLKVSKDAARITRFDKNYKTFLKSAITPEEAYELFEPYLLNPDYYIIGHNFLGFDVYQIMNWARGVGKKLDWGWVERVIDSNCLAKAIAQNIKPDRENFLAWQYKLNHERIRGLKTNLTHVAKQYDIPVDSDKMHDALEDIKVNAYVFGRQLHEIEI